MSIPPDQCRRPVFGLFLARSILAPESSQEYDAIFFQQQERPVQDRKRRRLQAQAREFGSNAFPYRLSGEPYPPLGSVQSTRDEEPEKMWPFDGFHKYFDTALALS